MGRTSDEELEDIEKAWLFTKIMVKAQMPSLSNKVAFFRMMSICQKAWLGMRETLVSLAWSEKHPWMKKIMQDILKQLNQWISLNIAMENHLYFFWAENIELIKSSEIMWNLPEVLNEIANELESFQKLLSKIKSSMMYPLMVLLMAIWAVIVLLIKVMPSIVTLFPNQETLPWITKFMLWVSWFLQTSWWTIFLVIIPTIVGYKVSYDKLPEFKKFMDLVFLRIPVIKDINRKFYHYRFCKLLWDFSKSWVSPVVALAQIYDVFKNYHYKDKVRKIKSDLEVWFTFTEAMEWSWLFDDIIVQIISIWEKAWNVWEVLQKMSLFYREELDTKLEWMMKLLEPLLMWFIAIIVWVIVASIFMPMAEIIWSIGWGS